MHFETGAFLSAGETDYANIQFQFGPFGGTYKEARETRADEPMYFTVAPTSADHPSPLSNLVRAPAN